MQCCGSPDLLQTIKRQKQMTEHAITTAARKAQDESKPAGADRKHSHAHHSHSEHDGHAHHHSHSHADEDEDTAIERFEALQLERSREWRRVLGETVTAINEILDEIRADGLED
jgi:hypothetical protein